MAYYSEATSEVFNTIMGAAQGITDIFGSIKRSKNTSGYLQRSSIMKASKDLIMSFPTIVPESITPETMSMIAKAVEHNCVTTLQLLFSAANLKGMDGMDVLSQWHKNIDSSNMDIDDYLDAVDTVGAVVGETAMLEAAADKYVDEMLREYTEMTQKVYPVSSFNENSLNQFYIQDHNGVLNVYVTEAPGDLSRIAKIVGDSMKDHYSHHGQNNTIGGIDYSRAAQDLEGLVGTSNKVSVRRDDRRDRKEDVRWRRDEAKRDQANREKDFEQKERFHQDDLSQRSDELGFKKDQFDYQKTRDDIADRYNRERDTIKDKLDQDKLDIDRDKAEIERRKVDSQINRYAKQDLGDQVDFFSKQLLASDVKKANEMVPSMIIVRFNALPDEGENYTSPNYQQFIAGVKARVISCPSMEIIDAIRATERSKVNLTNLIRATTKEISFCRDFIAGIDQAKIDAKRNSKLTKTSPIWRSLQWRSSKSIMNRLKRRKPNDAGAITTLVLTSEEVNFMKTEYKIDLMVPKTAKSIMETYNLMCLCIVDEEVEVARFLYDGEKYFQDYSFSALERETGDNSYKKVINLMSKMNR